MEDLQNRISFMREVVRGDCEPFESPDEWLAGLAEATGEAELMAGAALDHLRTVGRQWDFGGRSYACDAEALIGFARRIVTGDYHDPLAPLPFLDIGADGRLEDPRELRMNRFRTAILMGEGFETLAAQVRRRCSVLVVRESSDTASELPRPASGTAMSDDEWRRSFTALPGRSGTGPRRLWRIVSRLAVAKRGLLLNANESCGWNYGKGKIQSNRDRDREALLRHKVRGAPVMVRVGRSRYSVDVPLPNWLLDELDGEHPIEG